MKTRKKSLLRWVAMIELFLGAYDLMNGLLSAYVLITDLEGAMASFTESGVEFSVPILVISVTITCIGGLIMALAGAIGMIFAAIPGKQKLPLYCGYGLFAFAIMSAVIQIAFMGAGFPLSMLLSLVLYGLYMWGAVKNKKELEAAGV